MSFETPRVPRAILAAAVLVLLGVPASAQTSTAPEVVPLKVASIPWLVVDARGGFTTAGMDATTALDLGVGEDDLPNRVRTLVVGAHIYPLRRGALTVGVGGEFLRGTGSSQRMDADGAAVGPNVHRRLNGVSGQVSLNFGKGRGWSYITVGSGPFKFESYLDDAEPDGVGKSTINYGGGARWFARSHLAFTVDLRFYLTRPANPTAATAGRARQRLVLFSAGISLK